MIKEMFREAGADGRLILLALVKEDRLSIPYAISFQPTS